MKKYKKNSC